MAGAKGYLVKDIGPDDLKKMVRAVHRGNAVLDPRVTPQILATVAAGRARHPRQADSPRNGSLLSETDLAIIRYLSLVNLRMAADPWPNLRGVHAFVIDDNEDSRRLVEQALHYCGALVTVFQSTAAARVAGISTHI